MAAVLGAGNLPVLGQVRPVLGAEHPTGQQLTGAGTGQDEVPAHTHTRPWVRVWSWSCLWARIHLWIRTAPRVGLHLGLCLDLDQDLELDSDPHLDLHLELNLDPHLDLPLELDSDPHLDQSLGHASFTKDG